MKNRQVLTQQIDREFQYPNEKYAGFNTEWMIINGFYNGWIVNHECTLLRMDHEWIFIANFYKWILQRMDRESRMHNITDGS